MKNDLLSLRSQVFFQEKLQEDPTFFKQLEQGQSPEVFMIACCDSRVDPSVITQMPLGTLFVYRNVANQVVEGDTGFEAALCYALKHLGIKKIAVKGHTGCGGIAAAWNGNTDPGLRQWIREIRDSLPDPGERPDLSQDELAKINVLKQVERLKKHPVYRSYGKEVEVMGYLFHLDSGELEPLT